MLLEVEHLPDRHAYFASLEGKQVGSAHYRIQPSDGDAPDVWVFDSTEVDPEYRGRGIAGGLLTAVFDDVRTRDVSVRPTCPFVVAWFETHPEYADLLETR